MAITYKVTTAPAGKGNLFNITWFHVETGTEASFEQSAAGISREEVETLWQKPQHQLQIGQKLFRFLDGEAHHLQRALDQAKQHGQPLQLLLCPCNRTAD